MSNRWSADRATGKKARAREKGDGTSAACEANEYCASCKNANYHNHRRAGYENGNNHN
jgi:hypothetical protein